MQNRSLTVSAAKAAALGFAAGTVAVALSLVVAAMFRADKRDPVTPPPAAPPQWWTPCRAPGALLIAVVGGVIAGLILLALQAITH
jgi:hypothetical protein